MLRGLLAPCAPRMSWEMEEEPVWVYIIECAAENTYYVGETNDVHRRVAEHRGRGNYPGSTFVERFGFKKLFHAEYVLGKAAAKARERELTQELYGLGLIVGSNFASVRRDGSVVLQ